jgi:hypothetical protein
MNFSAEDLEEEDATAVTVWTMSWTLRVEGGMRRSLVKVRAIPPVAKMELSQHIFEVEYRAPGSLPIMPQRMVVVFDIVSGI